jgi:hypothetical protein
VFKDPGIIDPTNPNAALDAVVLFPGEQGDRNRFRGPGTFNIDAGVMKLFPITESQSVKLTGKGSTSPTPRASMWGR